MVDSNHNTEYLIEPLSRGAYSLRVFDRTMVPRYFPGETVYVDPSLPIEPGKATDVVVHLKSEESDERPTLLLKHFVGQTEEHLVLDQYNPPRKLRVPLSRVAAVHLIYESDPG